jgi:quercetin dioxygenase-like cupin family protein
MFRWNSWRVPTATQQAGRRGAIFDEYAEDEPVEQPVAVGSGQGLAIWHLDTLMTIKASGTDTAGAFGLMEVVRPPASAPPLHIHRREEESIWVLEGTMTVMRGNEILEGAPGSFVYLPRDVPHSFVVEGDVAARYLLLITPGGGEQYFIESGSLAEGTQHPPADPQGLERVKMIAPKFGIEVIGPPLQPTRARGG